MSIRLKEMKRKYRDIKSVIDDAMVELNQYSVISKQTYIKMLMLLRESSAELDLQIIHNEAIDQKRNLMKEKCEYCIKIIKEQFPTLNLKYKYDIKDDQHIVLYDSYRIDLDREFNDLLGKLLKEQFADEGFFNIYFSNEEDYD